MWAVSIPRSHKIIRTTAIIYNMARILSFYVRCSIPSQFSSRRQHRRETDLHMMLGDIQLFCVIIPRQVSRRYICFQGVNCAQHMTQVQKTASLALPISLSVYFLFVEMIRQLVRPRAAVIHYFTLPSRIGSHRDLKITLLRHPHPDYN